LDPEKIGGNGTAKFGAEVMRFSFVMPTYNRGYCIAASLQSILAQADDNAEIIVVDDGSTDDTATVIQNLAAPQIRYFRLPENGGTNNAKNLGATQAQGEWLVFLDSDDLLLPGGLELISQNITSQPRADLFFFPCLNWEGKSTVANPNFEGFVSYADLLRGKARGEYLPVVKKKAFQTCRFLPDVQGAEGISWLSLARTQACFVSSEAARAYNHQATDRISAGGNRQDQARKPHLWNPRLRLSIAHSWMLRKHAWGMLRYAPQLLVSTVGKIIFYRLSYWLKG
jgi:glycosyltransferase involved in cell wall biosynthesis